MRCSTSVMVIATALLATSANAEIINPVAYIEKNGYQSVVIGDDGRTRIYSYTESTNTHRVKTLEQDITPLPKNPDIYKVCDMFRGGVKAKLIEERGVALDVAVADYGYKGTTFVCALKYMQGNKVGTQLIYAGKQPNGLYMVIVVD